VAPDNSQEVDEQNQPILKNFQPSGKFGSPKHVGMRYYVDIPEEDRWHDENDD
jgi:hypothetical protein